MSDGYFELEFGGLRMKLPIAKHSEKISTDIIPNLIKETNGYKKPKWILDKKGKIKKNA